MKKNLLIVLLCTQIVGLTSLFGAAKEEQVSIVELGDWGSEAREEHYSLWAKRYYLLLAGVTDWDDVYDTRKYDSPYQLLSNTEHVKKCLDVVYKEAKRLEQDAATLLRSSVDPKKFIDGLDIFFTEKLHYSSPKGEGYSSTFYEAFWKYGRAEMSRYNDGECRFLHGTNASYLGAPVKLHAIEVLKHIKGKMRAVTFDPVSVHEAPNQDDLEIKFRAIVLDYCRAYVKFLVLQKYFNLIVSISKYRKTHPTTKITAANQVQVCLCAALGNTRCPAGDYGISPYRITLEQIIEHAEKCKVCRD